MGRRKGRGERMKVSINARMRIRMRVRVTHSPHEVLGDTVGSDSHSRLLPLFVLLAGRGTWNYRLQRRRVLRRARGAEGSTSLGVGGLKSLELVGSNHRLRLSSRIMRGRWNSVCSSTAFGG